MLSFLKMTYPSQISSGTWREGTVSRSTGTRLEGGCDGKWRIDALWTCKLLHLFEVLCEEKQEDSSFHYRYTTRDLEKKL